MTTMRAIAAIPTACKCPASAEAKQLACSKWDLAQTSSPQSQSPENPGPKDAKAAHSSPLSPTTKFAKLGWCGASMGNTA